MMQRGRTDIAELSSQLHSAVEENNATVCEEILEQCQGCYQESAMNLGAALCKAVRNSNMEIVLLLLRAHADVRYIMSDDGQRAIHYAVSNGDVEIVKLILTAGSSANVVDSAGKTPIHYAVECGNIAIVKYLIDKGSSTRCRTYKEGETPLHIAARLGNAEVCRLILTRGGNVNLKSRRDATPLHVAVKAKNFGVVSLLCEAGANLEEVNEKGQTVLLLAVELSSAEMIRKLLAFGANVNARDMRGRTCMHYLAMSLPNEMHLEMAKLLVAAGLQDTSTEDVDRYTPLHYAAFKGNIPFVKLLLVFGTDINKFYAWRLDTPLNMAISNKQVEMVKFLLDAGVDVTQVDGPLTRVTALHKIMVTRYLHVEEKLQIIELLISHGAKLNTLTARDHTPLEDCVFYSAVFRDSSLPILMRLVSAGAKPAQGAGCVRSDPKSSPLCWLTWHGSQQAARFLVSVGWNLQQETWIYLPGKDEEASKFLVWLQEMVHIPHTLRSICRSLIRNHLVEHVSGDSDIAPFVSRLPLPVIIKKFLMLKPEMDEFSNSPVNVHVT